MLITVAARDSLLSRAQVEEVLKEIKVVHPEVDFISTFVSTPGDRDLNTSLRTLEKSDFFTQDVDALILKKTCRVAVHSAKDLPDPLPQGLELIALTKGVDASDVMVLKTGQEEVFESDKILRVGSSSERRDFLVKQLFPNALCLDIRGTIERRLALLDLGHYDAVVMAEAALIRLNLMHRKRIVLPGPSALNQGRLAIIAHKDDVEIKQFIGSCLKKF